jgi:type II secretory pathway pseudopilin PulG
LFFALEEEEIVLMFCAKRIGENSSAGLTLVELLIIIAVLFVMAALSPSFWYRDEGPERAKVAQAQRDMRSLASAIEAYCLDQGGYPVVTEKNRSPLSARLRVLTTPVAYLAQIPLDVFQDRKKANLPEGGKETYYYFLETTATLERNDAVPHSDGAKWRLVSAGPDRVQECGTVIYDATNGTKSRGDVVLTSDDPSIKKPKPVGTKGMAN